MNRPPSPNMDLNRTPEFYFSAPSSPSHHLCRFDFDHFPTNPRFKSPATNNESDFAFAVAEETKSISASAEELFQDGLIRPMISLPPSPTRTNQKQNKTKTNTFAVSPQRVTRGEKRDVNFTKSVSNRRAARSVSPVRNDQRQPWQEREERNRGSVKGGSKKWRFKDLFLFRSASEGRAAEKDPLKKYTAASFRPFKSGSGSGGKRRGPVSAHELHYTTNRAVSEDLKKKTFLPYKQGILGRLSFFKSFHTGV